MKTTQILLMIAALFLVSCGQDDFYKAIRNAEEVVEMGEFITSEMPYVEDEMLDELINDITSIRDYLLIGYIEFTVRVDEEEARSLIERVKITTKRLDIVITDMKLEQIRREKEIPKGFSI